MMKITILIVLLILFVFSVNAQTNLGTIEGVVLDPEGAVIPNARVTINFKSSAGNNENPRSVLTNENGEFKFLNLPPGLYELELKVRGIETIFKKQVEIKSGESSESNIRVKIVLEPCSGDEPPDISLTNEDKAEIVRQMLKMNEDLWKEEKRKSKPVLSTKNIKREWLTAEEKQNFKLVKQAEIQYRADTRSDFMYLSFSELKVKGGCVAVSLNYSWAVGKNSQTLYLSGAGNTYEFRKVNGQWTGKYIMGWIS